MKKVKVSEATRIQLDRMVAKCMGYDAFMYKGQLNTLFTEDGWSPTTPWSQGGPIIERQEIELLKWAIDGWMAKDTNYQFLNTPQERGHFAEMYGPTPLIAAMRCFVVSKLGDEVEVPDVMCADNTLRIGSDDWCPTVSLVFHPLGGVSFFLEDVVTEEP